MAAVLAGPTVNPDLVRQYEKAGFRGRIGFGEHPAIVVVDLNRGFTDPACPLGGDLTAVVEVTRALLDRARASNVPVIFTTMGYDDPAAEIGPWLRKVPSLAVLRIGSEWLDVDDRLAPRPEEPVVLKKFTSAFFRTELEDLLHAAGIDTVIVTGCTTSGCVRATAIDSTQRRFRTIIPREAVGDRAPGPHEANLFDLDSKWTDVVGVDEVMEYVGRIGAEQRHSSPA